jgi:cytochrome P450
MTAKYATREDRRVVFRSHGVGYAALKLISRAGPVVRVPGVGVVVSDAQTIRDILLDSGHFSKVGPGGSSELWSPVIGPRALLNMDGQEHAHLRKQLAPLFTPRFLNEIVSDTLEPHFTRMRNDIIAGRPVDVVEAAETGAALIICRLTGFRTDDVEAAAVQLAKARQVLSYASLTTRRFTDRQVNQMKALLDDMTGGARTSYRDAAPGTVPALLREAGLSEDDTISVITALVVAGTETIVSFLPRLTQILLQSGWMQKVAENPGLSSATVTEALRVTVPSPVMIRAVSEATTIRSIGVRPGDRIVLSTLMACQAAGDFNPDVPVPKPMRQLWFGAGAHFCIGMPLAILEAEMFITALAAAYRERPFGLSRKTYKRRTIAAGYKELTVCAP